MNISFLGYTETQSIMIKYLKKKFVEIHFSE